MSRETEIVNFRVVPKIRQQLRIIADHEGLTVSELVRRAIDVYFKATYLSNGASNGIQAKSKSERR